MLVEFKVKNFRSFKDETIFTMEPQSFNGMNYNIINTELKKVQQVYRTSGIFGANASGKSNFLYAISCLKYIVKKSFKNDIEKELPKDCYLLDSDSINQPTNFEITFIFKSKLYKYRIAFSSKEIIKESLTCADITSDGSARDNKIFTRDKEEGIKAKGISQAWIDEIANNRSFLSEVINNRNCKIPEFVETYDYITKKLSTANSRSSMNYSLDMLQSEYKDQMLKCLQNADLGFVDIDIKKIPTEVIISRLKEENDKDKNKAREMMISRLMSGSSELIDVKVKHKDENGGIAEISLDDESQGSKIFLSLTGPIVNALENGNTLFIDELDASLHPTLVKYIITLFNNSNINKKNAQLIFTSHAFYLMDGETLTRDQIWLVGKDNGYSSSLKSLKDCNEPRKNKSFANSYFNGEYGFLPNINI